MERRPRTPGQAPGELTEEAVAGLRAAASAHPEPLLLGYYPHFKTNPYQALLYRQVREEGIAPVGIRHLDTIPELTELAKSGLNTALHLHWLHLALIDAGSGRAATRDTRRFLAAVDAFRETGAPLIWTVHNILSQLGRL